MLLTEQIQVKYSKELSLLCHKAKNLYNLANWYYRQDFFHLENFLSYYDLDFILKHHSCYKQLPAQTSQQILRLLIKNWKSYFKAKREWKINKFKFKAVPKFPKYKKKNGESIAIFTNQNTRLKDGTIHFPGKCCITPIKTRISQYRQVRIVPKGNYYVIEIIYEKKEIDLGLNKSNCISIDLGVNNLITSVNNVGLEPIIIKGKVVKSINQYYNKLRAYYQSLINKQGIVKDTRRMLQMTKKRDNKIRDHFHKVSKKLIEYCIDNDIGTIIIGYNEGWKQNVNIGKRNNQNFVSMPFYKLIQMIGYKSKLIGIEVILTEESYTSICSALDLEDLERQDVYKGKRISRGLFRSNKGTIINADVNGAFNIMRKVVPIDRMVDGIEALVLTPQIVKIS